MCRVFPNHILLALQWLLMLLSVLHVSLVLSFFLGENCLNYVIVPMYYYMQSGLYLGRIGFDSIPPERPPSALREWGVTIVGVYVALVVMSVGDWESQKAIT